MDIRTTTSKLKLHGRLVQTAIELSSHDQTSGKYVKSHSSASGIQFERSNLARRDFNASLIKSPTMCQSGQLEQGLSPLG